MKAQKLVIYFLSLVMILSAFAPLATVSVFAADDDIKDEQTAEEETYDYLG